MKIAALTALLFALPAFAQDKADARAGIQKACLDYIEGWYEGDAARMERALHPDLAKRIVRSGPNGKSNLQQMSAMGLVQGVRAGYGKQTPKEKQQKDVTVLDVFENAATAKIIASDWVDYLHLARWNGEWKIVNVLWELKPQESHAKNQQKDVTVLDVFENAATAKIIASDWVDYLHLARWNGEWKIVNVLWELKPQESHAKNQQ